MVDIGYLVIMVIVIIINFLTGTLLAIKGNKNILLGCIVTEEIKNDEKTNILIKKYINLNILISLASIMLIIISYIRNSISLSIIGIFIDIIGSMFVYAIYNRKMKILKKSLGGLSEKKQIVIFDIKENKYNFKRLIRLLIITVSIIFINLILIIKRYNILPDKIGIKYDFSGDVTRYANKSYLAVGNIIIGMLFISILFIGIDYILQVKKLKIDPTNPESSKESNLKYKDIISNMMMIILIITLIMLTISNLQMLQLIKNVVFIIIILNAVLMIITIYSLVKVFKIKNSYKSKNINVIQKDDDSNWKFGFIYYNKQDPSIMVEKRMGIGWTLNAGNKIGLVMYILILIFLIFSVYIGVTQ